MGVYSDTDRDTVDDDGKLPDSARTGEDQPLSEVAESEDVSSRVSSDRPSPQSMSHNYRGSGLSLKNLRTFTSFKNRTFIW